MNGEFLYSHRLADGRANRNDNTSPSIDDNRYTSSATPALTPVTRARNCYVEYSSNNANQQSVNDACSIPTIAQGQPYAMRSVCAGNISHNQDFVFGTSSSTHIGSHQLPVNMHAMSHPFFTGDYYTNGIVSSGGSNGSGGVNNVASNNCNNLTPLISLQTVGNTINQGSYTLSHLNRCNIMPSGPFGPVGIQSSTPISPNQIGYQNATAAMFTPHFVAAAMEYPSALRYSNAADTSSATHGSVFYQPTTSNNTTVNNSNVHPFYQGSKIRDTFLTLTKLKQRSADKPETECCKVCGAKSSGFHFGVFTCEACKGFFRRYSRKQRVITPCSRPCEITVSNRNNCPACRFSKCKAVGMAIENIRYGKPPKVVKIPRTLNSTIPKLDDKTILPKLLDAYNTSIPINTTSKTVAFLRYTSSVLKIPQVLDTKVVIPPELQRMLFAVFNEELPEPHRILDTFEKILICLFAQYKDAISTNENSIGDKILQMSEQIFYSDKKRKARFMLTMVYVTSMYI